MKLQDSDELLVGNGRLPTRTECVGARADECGHAPDGSIFYAAIYSVALDPAEIATHVELLAQSDDTFGR